MLTKNENYFFPYKMLSASLLLIPRVAASYPLYSLASFVLSLDAKYKIRSIGFAIVVLAYCVSHILILSLFYKVSMMNMILDYIQLLPFFLIMLKPMRSWEYDGRLIIQVNYIVLLLSLANMVINFGFPMRLPYIDFLPDAIAAFWGNGGVKITTVFGFMGVLSLFKNPEERSFLAWSVVIFNLMLPSYNIGIASALLALSYLALRNMSFKSILKMLIVGVILSASLVPYVVGRLDGLSPVFYDEFGMHPKIYAIYMYLNLFLTDTWIFLFGGGLGNISGTAALWANESISSISSHTPINLPGMFESEMHQKILGDALSIIELDPWAVLSSFNKPYFTIVTFFFEFGLIVGGGLLIIFFNSILTGGLDKAYGRVLAIFILSIFLIDNIHANPLFWGAILVGLRALIDDDSRAKIG